jgi:peroxiredoxin
LGGSERSSRGLYLDHPTEPEVSAKAFLLLVVFAAVQALAGTADEDWQALIALDAGPRPTSQTVAGVKTAVISHLETQEQLLRGFLAHHASDPRAFEASLRLVRLLGLRGSMRNDNKAYAEAFRLLDRLEKSMMPEQRADLDFARLSLTMRQIDRPSAAEREKLFAQVRKFQADHPDDRRLADTLAEVASLFDLQPQKKQQLLLDAQALAQEEQLKARIADDLRRIELLHQPITFSAPALDGKKLDLADHRGRLVILCFFARWSEPSIEAIEKLKKTMAGFRKETVELIGVSLDTKREAVAELLKEKGITWPVAFDGESWGSSRIRALGINALPTVWLLDREGRLRSLDALEGTVDQIRQLLNGR